MLSSCWYTECLWPSFPLPVGSSCVFAASSSSPLGSPSSCFIGAGVPPAGAGGRVMEAAQPSGFPPLPILPTARSEGIRQLLSDPAPRDDKMRARLEFLECCRACKGSGINTPKLLMVMGASRNGYKASAPGRSPLQSCSTKSQIS